MSLIPPLGASGIYKLKSSFPIQPRANVSYRCDSIRRFNEILETNVDPFTEYYKKIGLTTQDFNRDAGTNTPIVSLVSEAQHWIHVPAHYIDAYPNQGGVPYQGLVLGIPLGPVPTYTDLSGVKMAIENVVRDQLGITVQANFVSVTEVENLSQADHDRIEASRAYAVSNAVTDRAKYLELQASFQELQARNRELEAYIRSRP